MVKRCTVLFLPASVIDIPRKMFKQLSNDLLSLVSFNVNVLPITNLGHLWSIVCLSTHRSRSDGGCYSVSNLQNLSFVYYNQDGKLGSAFPLA